MIDSPKYPPAIRRLYTFAVALSFHPLNPHRTPQATSPLHTWTAARGLHTCAIAMGSLIY
jgi:hypothetical protein